MKGRKTAIPEKLHGDDACTFKFSGSKVLICCGSENHERNTGSESVNRHPFRSRKDLIGSKRQMRNNESLNI